MTETREQIYEQMKEMFGQVPTWIKEMPDAATPHFFGLMRDLDMAETSIPNKYKELIGVAVAGATRCRYCAFFHTEAAKLFGASEDEIREASMVAAYSAAGSTFLNAKQVDYAEFEKQTREMVEYAKEHMEQNGKKNEKKRQRPQPSA